MARKPKAPAIVPSDVPPVPVLPPTAEEIASEQRLLEDMRDMADRLLQRNLDIAVSLAQQAARRQGPLVDHFQELGRRFAKTLNAPKQPRRPNLQLVRSGAISEEERIEAAVAKHGGIIAAMRAGAI